MTWARRSDRGDPAKVLERRQELPPVRISAWSRANSTGAAFWPAVMACR